MSPVHDRTSNGALLTRDIAKFQMLAIANDDLKNWTIGIRLFQSLCSDVVDLQATSETLLLHCLLQGKGAGLVFLEEVQSSVEGDLSASVSADISSVEVWAMV
jgi:hypothetical protein